MAIRLIHGDARSLPLPDASVDLVVTSPPYFGLRVYEDGGRDLFEQIGGEATPTEFIDELLAATAEMVRVVKPSGSLWVNLGDKYSGGYRRTGTTHGTARAKSLMGIPWRYVLRCIDDLDLILRAEVIWSKPNSLPESVTDRVRRSHEHWFHLTLGPRYYANIDAIREPHLTVTPGPRRHSGAAFGQDKAGRGGDGSGHTDGHPLGKLPPSVWTIPTEPLRVPKEVGVEHFAAFPTEFPRRIIRAFCPPGGTVLDPFMGTGTVPLVADVLGRNGVGVDLSADYCRLAQWRTTDPRQRDKAAGTRRKEKGRP